VCLQSIRGQPPRLQSFRRGFPAAGGTSGPSSGLPLPKTASQLRRFLSMLKFYMRFLPQVAVIQAPLHDALFGTRVKDSHPITWKPDLYRVFEECKASLSHALLAHPDSSAPFALVTEASTSVKGALLQQHVNNTWHCLAFFYK
jgi:hypothetical protein